MPNFVYDQGAGLTLSKLLSVQSADSFGICLSTSSVPFSPTDTYPPLYPEPSDSGYAPFNLTAGGWSLAQVEGTWTILWNVPVWEFTGSSSISQTVRQWWIECPGESSLIWSGAVSPAYTIPVGVGGLFGLEDCSMSLGTCSPSSVPYLLLIGGDSPSGTPLTAYVPDVGPSATTYTSSGTLSATIEARTVQVHRNTGGESSALWDLGQPDYTLTCWLTITPATEDAGVLVRAADAANGWLIDLDGTLGQVVLYQLEAGVFSSVSSTALSASAAGTHYAQVTCSGDTISVTVDFDDTITYTSASFGATATLGGVFIGGESTSPSVQFAGLSVVPLP